ncbi:hypothetical protein B0H10DRAFT_969944 [Mycena sp. CBHHK59/15]|nr:hypothetical protein B0H10DRAFT_969944 [Mycena sp. CBHHK59/15]
MDATADAQSQLFIEHGTPIKFYVDPGSVLGRPKLIRVLKGAGAYIASDPKDADFLLVQSDSPTGRHFIRDWSAEKTILEAVWVSKTITAGRLLKEQDQWGGCLTVDDPSRRSELEDDLDQNPLPTPCITPVETTPNTWSSDSSAYPPQDLHHSSQQPPGMNGHMYPNNFPNPATIQQQPPSQHQMQTPQFSQQPGMQQQQPFYPFAMQPQQFPPGVVPGMVDPNIYSMVLMDVLKNRGLLPWTGPSQQALVQNGMQQGFFLPQLNPMMQNAQTYSQPPGLIPVAHDLSASPPPGSDTLLPSLRRKSPPLSLRSKGKGKASSYTHRDFSGSRDSAGSSRTTASSSTAVEDIFTSSDGEPLTFFVQIEVHKRTDLVNHIKRHGGQISTQTTADYAILSFRSKLFEGLLEAIINDNGKAVKPAFVLDSVEQDMLLDASDYQFEIPSKLLQKSNKPSSKTDSEKKQAAKRLNPGLSRPRIPSPTPPPEHTRVHHAGDKYKYSEVETEYVLRYATVLFERDHETSLTSLFTKLHAKMPHHSVAAWNNYVSRKLRDEVENIRKKAGIAYRKEQNALQNQSRQVIDVDEPPPKRARVEVPVEPDTAAVAKDPEEEDLNTVAQFFANGGDTEQTDGGDEDQSVKDARVWARLTDQVACKTESSWEIFYNKHHKRVMELYEVLIGPQDESPQSEPE